MKPLEYIALDGGSTGTRGGRYTADGFCVAEAEGAPSNPVLLPLSSAVAALVAVIKKLGIPSDNWQCGAGISGAGKHSLRDRLAEQLLVHTGAERVMITHDLAPILIANAPDSPAVVAVAGTGSSVVAWDGARHTTTVGGRGRIFGDPGSAYAIAVAALQAMAAALDGLGPSTRLVEALPRAANQETIHDLPAWTEKADKATIAALAKCVIDVAEAGDTVAAVCITRQARLLARQVCAAMEKLSLPADTPVFEQGTLFTRISFATPFRNAIREKRPQCMAGPPALSGHAAVAAMARQAQVPPGFPVSIKEKKSRATISLLPPTEQRGPWQKPLDALAPVEIARRMNKNDREIPGVVSKSIEVIAQVIERVAKTLQKGGRLIYVGAGTSGRLGVLDASECPPTFGVAPDRVIGIIAGGEPALRTSVEGAEDDTEQAARDLVAVNVSDQDVVVGIAASGTTRYVRSALTYATGKGADTVLLCCNPAIPPDSATWVIALDTGPEVLPGSTRLKAGTATKMVLNMISTGALTLAGYVFEGYMVNMTPVNDKLRARAVRIITALTDLSEEDAQTRLEQANGSIPAVILSARTGCSLAEAFKRLEQAHYNLRSLLQ